MSEIHKYDRLYRHCSGQKIIARYDCWLLYYESNPILPYKCFGDDESR